MGKIREAFRLILDEPFTPVVNGPTVIESAESRPFSDSMPFIEIGPRREIDGSPDVMAVAVPSNRLSPTSTPPSPPPPPAAAPTAAQVKFRSVAAVPRLAENPRRGIFAPELIAYHAADQAASAQYAELLSAITAAATGRSPRLPNVFCFTAVRTRIGCTTVLLNLAITAARQGQQVIVVDANLRRPAIAEKVGLEPHPGLTEVLIGSLPLKDAIRETAQDHLRVLSAGAPAALWADLSSLSELLGTLSSSSDLVFIDGPCWDGRSVSAGIPAACGAAFLVLPSSEADSPATADLTNKLPVQGIPLAGTLFTAG